MATMILLSGVLKLSGRYSTSQVAPVLFRCLVTRYLEMISSRTYCQPEGACRIEPNQTVALIEELTGFGDCCRLMRLCLQPGRSCRIFRLICSSCSVIANNAQ